MAHRTVLVVGNSISALFATLSLADDGWDVTLLTPSRKMGGHFAGLELGGQLFDAGMVFLEFTSFNADENAHVSTYDPHRRNDVGRFFPLIASTLSTYGTWRDVEPPQMRAGGTLLPDLLLTNELDALRQLPQATRTQLLVSLRQAIADGKPELHSARKGEPGAYETASLEQASTACHGQALHSLLIEPFCHKVTATSASALLARYHRAAWAPLFYPETLAAVFNGENVQLPPTRFSYPVHASVAHLVRRVDEVVRLHPRVRVVDGTVARVAADSGRHYAVSTTADETLSATRLVWAADSDKLISASGVSATSTLDRTSIALASALVQSSRLRQHCSTLLVLDNENWPFRVTNQSLAAGDDEPLSRISLEWNAAFFAESAPEGRAARVANTLCELEIIHDRADIGELRVDVIPNALVLPTARSVESWRERLAVLDNILPNVPRLGPAAPFGTTSFNDQVVQGLKVAHDLRDYA